jgi:hypothetical protein
VPHLGHTRGLLGPHAKGECGQSASHRLPLLGWASGRCVTSPGDYMRKGGGAKNETGSTKSVCG